MDAQQLFNIAVGLAAFFGGFMVKSIHQAVRDLQNSDQKLADKVQSIEVLVAGQYIKKEDFERTVTALFAKLDVILDRIDSKVDRSECERFHK